MLKVLHNYLNLGFHVGSSPYLASFITLDILLMIFCNGTSIVIYNYPLSIASCKETKPLHHSYC